MKYLITIDIDGTLVDSNGSLPSYNKEIIKMAVLKGHKVVLATGRTYSGALPIYEKLGLDTPIIANNGATIKNPSDTSFKDKNKLIKSDTIHEIFIKTKDLIKGCYYSIDNITYAYNYNKDAELMINGVKSDTLYEGELLEFNNDASVLIFLVNPSKRHDFYKIIGKYKNLAYRVWDKNKEYYLVEIYANKISKYTGMKYLRGFYKIKKNNTIAFGDYTNDILMIKKAKYGVALKNAVDQLKVVAKYTSTYTNDESAVGIELKKILHL